MKIIFSIFVMFFCSFCFCQNIIEFKPQLMYGRGNKEKKDEKWIAMELDISLVVFDLAAEKIKVFYSDNTATYLISSYTSKVEWNYLGVYLFNFLITRSGGEDKLRKIFLEGSEPVPGSATNVYLDFEDLHIRLLGDVKAR